MARPVGPSPAPASVHHADPLVSVRQHEMKGVRVEGACEGDAADINKWLTAMH